MKKKRTEFEDEGSWNSDLLQADEVGADFTAANHSSASVVTLFVVSLFSLCSVLPFTLRRLSSMSGSFPGPFFFFSLARIEDSLSGNGGISSRTVACAEKQEVS